MNLHTPEKKYFYKESAAAAAAACKPPRKHTRNMSVTATPKPSIWCNGVGGWWVVVA